MTSHLGALLDWTVADLAFLGIAIQQYISISLDLKRTKAREAEEKKRQPVRANLCEATQQPAHPPQGGAGPTPVPQPPILSLPAASETATNTSPTA